jgi:RNA polymerase sigma-70 factor (ECF subfamily)
MNKQVDRSLRNRRQELLGILPNIRRFALSLTASPADADDLLQSTVERLLVRGLPADAAVLPYSLTVCRNLWIDEIRSRRVRQATADETTLADEQLSAGDEQAVGELSLREMQNALMALPEEQRSVLELVAVEGCSYKEAAAVLDIPIGTVMSRLARARSALADRVQDETFPAERSGGEGHE